MKNSSLFFLLVCLVTLISCDSKSRIVSFDKPFPKPNRDLTQVLGQTLRLKSETDTLDLAISADKHHNLILNTRTGDTLFYGKVSKYRGLYYLSKRTDDSLFTISAMKVEGNLVYGLTSGWAQQMRLYEMASKGELKKLVTYMAPDSSIFRLKADKPEVRKLFTDLYDRYAPDTILSLPAKLEAPVNAQAATISNDPEELALVTSIYPNPITEFVMVEVQKKNEVDFALSDLQGRKLKWGKLKEILNRIDLHTLPQGVYFLTFNTKSQRESMKLIKS